MKSTIRETVLMGCGNGEQRVDRGLIYNGMKSLCIGVTGGKKGFPYVVWEDSMMVKWIEIGLARDGVSEPVCGADMKMGNSDLVKLSESRQRMKTAMRLTQDY
jgi:hypothetical protein